MNNDDLFSSPYNKGTQAREPQTLRHSRTPTIPKNAVKGLGSKAPSVVIKNISTAHSAKNLRDMLSYISRHSELNIEVSDGYRLTSKEDQRELINDWEADFSTRKNARHATHTMISAPAGTDRTKFRAAVSEYLSKEYRHHSHAFVEHKDTDCPHVHVIIKNRGHDGQALRSNKKILRESKSRFVDIAAKHGLDFKSVPNYLQNISGNSVIKRDRYPYAKTRYNNPPTSTYTHSVHAQKEFGQQLRTALGKTIKDLGDDVKTLSQNPDWHKALGNTVNTIKQLTEPSKSPDRIL